MATRNGKVNSSDEKGKAQSDSAKDAASGQVQLSRALQVLNDGLRTIDDAADLLRACLIDMETGTRPRSYTQQHLNGVGKFIQLKDRKDRADSMVKKLGSQGLNLPGTTRKFA